MRYLITAALLLSGVVHAQTIAWNRDELTWSAPTTCADGSPIADCPISGYRIETAPTATATTWTTITTTVASVSTYTLTVSAGQHCYRVFALSGALSSVPSNVACDTAVGPAPGPTGTLTVR